MCYVSAKKVPNSLCRPVCVPMLLPTTEKRREKNLHKMETPAKKK